VRPKETVLGVLASKKGVYLGITQHRPFTAVRPKETVLGVLASKKGVYLGITQHRPFSLRRCGLKRRCWACWAFSRAKKEFIWESPSTVRLVYGGAP